METDLRRACINHRYQVEELLGSGAMGSVYRVSDILDNGATLALKKLHLDSKEVESFVLFQHEFEILRKLNHPNLAPVFDYGLVEGTGNPFFTSQLVEGRDLLAASAGLPHHCLYGLLVQICRGLEYIHSRGLIHYDIKPSNILVEGDPTADAHVKLIDFGLAGELDLHEARVIKGSLFYLAPELARGDPIDRRADLYSLGATLFHVVTRRPLFEGTTNIEVIKQHLEVPARDPWEFVPGLPKLLRDLILLLLEKEPSDRPSSGNDVIRWLNRRSNQRFVLETRETKKSYIQSGRFVGREEEYQQLLTDFHRIFEPATEQGERLPAVSLIGGPGGIGKSRLAREFRHYVQLKGVNWFEVSCPGHGGRAYGPLRELLDRILRVRPLSGERADGPREVIARFQDELWLLVPDCIPPRRANPRRLDAEQERLRIFEGATRLLIEIARLWPMVLHFENLHATDAETVEFLRYLSRNLRLPDGSKTLLSTPPPLMILLTGRAWEMSTGPTGRAIAALLEEGNIQELSLKPLSAQQVAHLIQSMLGGGGVNVGRNISDVLYRETGGNPFFVEESLKSLLDLGVLRKEREEWSVDEEDAAVHSLPHAVRDAIQARLARLEPSELALLETLSAFRHPVASALYAEVLQMPLAQLLPRLRELVRGQILEARRGEEGLLYGFQHDILRETVSSGLRPARSAAIHQAVAAVLEQRHGEDVAEIAYHYDRAGNIPKTVTYSLRAANKAREVFANRTALEYYERALANLEPDDAVWHQVLEGVAEVRERVGELDGALSALESLCARSDGLDNALRADLERRRGQVLEKKGEVDQALEAFSNGLRLLGASIQSTTGALLLNATGSVYVSKGLYDQALEFCESSLQLLEGLGDSLEVAMVYNTAGVARTCKGDYDQAWEWFQSSLEIRRKREDREGIAQCLNNMGTVAMERGEVEKAIEAFESALRIRRQTGSQQGLAASASNLGNAYRNLGDIKKAIEQYELSYRLQERIGDRPGRASTLSRLGVLHGECANYLPALEAFKKSGKLNQKLGQPREQVASLLGRAGVYVDIGCLEQGCSLARSVLDQAEQYELRKEEGEGYFLLGKAAARRGEHEEAERHFNRALNLFLKLGTHLESVRAMLEIGFVYVARGAHDIGRLLLRRIEKQIASGHFTAERAAAKLLEALLVPPAERRLPLEEALELAGSSSKPELLRRIHHELGSWHLAEGDLVLAGKHLVRAMEIVKQVWKGLREDLREDYLAEPSRRLLREDFRRYRGRLAG